MTIPIGARQLRDRFHFVIDSDTMRIQATSVAARDLSNRRLDGVNLSRHSLFHGSLCLLKPRAAPASAPCAIPGSSPATLPPPSFPIIPSILLSTCRMQLIVAGVLLAFDESLRARQVPLRLLELPHCIVALPDHLPDALLLQGCGGFEIVDMLLHRNLALVRRLLLLEVGHFSGFEVGLERREIAREQPLALQFSKNLLLLCASLALVQPGDLVNKNT